MAQLALYLDDELAARIDEMARREGVSRSAWVRSVLKEQLEDRLPESFFRVLGTWEDEREPEDILTDIRTAGPQEDRPDMD